MMKLTKKQAEAARQRRLQYEANMAVEGLQVSPEGRALLDQMDAEGIGGEEGVQMMIESLRARGLIPTESEDTTLAAE